MTVQQRTKQEILRQIKALTNSGRHVEAMGLYQRHFATESSTASIRASRARQPIR